MAKKKFKWILIVTGKGEFRVDAYTRSEARAIVKKKFDLKRLPVNTIIRKMKRQED